MYTFFKYVFYTLITALLIIVLLAILFYFISSDSFNDLKYYVFNYPILYFIPFLAALSYLAMDRFRENDDWGAEERPKSKMFYPLVALIVLVAFVTYFLFIKQDEKVIYADANRIKDSSFAAATTVQPEKDTLIKPVKNEVREVERDSAVVPMEIKPPAVKLGSAEAAKQKTKHSDVEIRYVTASKAYFYDEPDIHTKRSDYINNWKDSYLPLTPLQEKNGFVYVNFPDKQGTINSGWLRKKELKEVKILLNDGK